MGGGFSGGNFDPSQLGDIMGKSSSLTLEEYLKYAEAESVQDFDTWGRTLFVNFS